MRSSDVLSRPEAGDNGSSPLPRWARRRKHPRDPVTRILKPRHCEFYWPGHTVHWIQANRSFSEPHRLGHIVVIEENVIGVDFDTEVKRFRNHEVERLIEVVGRYGSVRVCEKYSILRSLGNYCFSIAFADKPWEECNSKPPYSASPDALEERLRTHGGFSVSGRKALNDLPANANDLEN